MLADIIMIIVALVALLIASISDLKTREVPDYASYGLIAAALGIRLIYSMISNEWLYFLYGIIGFAAMSAVGYALYYARQWGGGDTKLLMGLGAAFGSAPFYINEPIPFLLGMLANLFIVGAIYGLVWSFVMFFRHFRKASSELSAGIMKHKKSHLAFISFAIILLVLGLLIVELRLAFFVTAIVLWLYFYLYHFVRASEKVSMYKLISSRQLREGDWLANDVIAGKKIICSAKTLGIEKKQIDAIIKAKISKVMIKEGIAFVPSILIGAILSLIIGNIFIFFL